MRISDWSSDVCSSDLAGRSGEAGGDELPESVGAVADGVLRRGVELAEGRVMAVRPEHRVVAEAAFAARRPDEGAVHRPLEGLDMPVRPGARQGAGEMRAAAGLVGHTFIDRQSVVAGKRVTGRVDLGGRRIIKKKKK